MLDFCFVGKKAKTCPRHGDKTCNPTVAINHVEADVMKEESGQALKR